MSTETISKTSADLEQANSLASTDPTKAEELYRGILSNQTSMSSVPTLYEADNSADEDALRDQETALVKLGALYRDHK